MLGFLLGCRLPVAGAEKIFAGEGMGRVRVRVADCNDQKITQKIEVSKETSLGGFKLDVARAFGWPQGSNFGVSLNKQVRGGLVAGTF